MLFLLTPRPPGSTLSPYTTLFRSLHRPPSPTPFTDPIPRPCIPPSPHRKTTRLNPSPAKNPHPAFRLKQTSHPTRKGLDQHHRHAAPALLHPPHHHTPHAAPAPDP